MTTFNKSKTSLAIDGILLLDKPEGLTSNAVLQRIKKIYCARKAGHTGSLDPLASGMLPICFGEATKFSQFLLDADKHYQVTAQLGIKTTTGDREGEILEQRDIPQITEEILLSLLNQFTGSIEQIPSMYSAIKHNGQPLYKLARKGIEIERPPRTVTVHAMQLLSFNDHSFQFEIKCTKGTYVRTLVEDMGEVLGCGAHVIALRRLQVASYVADHMQTLPHLEQLQETHDWTTLQSYLLPADSSISHWPTLTVSEAAFYYLKQGQSIIAPTTTPSSGLVRLVRKDGSFLGVGEIIDGKWVAPKRLVQ